MQKKGILAWGKRVRQLGSEKKELFSWISL
jgi:hypothetical protein